MNESEVIGIFNAFDGGFEADGDNCKVKEEAQDPEFVKQHSDAIIEAVESCPVEAVKYETA